MRRLKAVSPSPSHHHCHSLQTHSGIHPTSTVPHVLHDGQNAGGAEPAGVRTLHPDAWDPASPQGLHRPAVRLQTRESRAVPATVLSETREGESKTKIINNTIYIGR